MKTDNAQFDVKNVLDDGAAHEWSVNKRWAHKVTFHTFMVWATAEVAKLGRKLSIADIDGYVSTLKEEDLDVPMTAAEIKERFRGAKSLSDIPATRAADQWLYAQKMGNRPAKSDFQLQKEMETQAMRLGHQLKLQIVQNIFGRVAEEIALADAGEDNTVPDYKPGTQYQCTFEGCAAHDRMMKRTLTRNGRALLHVDGPLKGMSKRVGNFIVVTGEGSIPEARSLCRDHVKIAVQNSLQTYVYGDAVALIDAIMQERAVILGREEKLRRDAEAMAKLAAEAPAAAVQKQRNQSVRSMRDSNRPRRK